MVALEEQISRDSKLKEIINKLSVNPRDFTEEIRQDLICEFKDIYTYSKDKNCEKKYNSDFRHKYSLLFGKLCEMKAQKKEIEYISINLEKLYEDYDVEDRVRENIFKLKDHIELEISRITYIDNIERQIYCTKEKSGYEINQISEQIVSANTKMNEVDKKVEKADSELNNMRTQTVTILGIFASILLAFVGGMAFSTSILENMHKVSTYKIIIVSSILGLVLVNVVYILTNFILKVNGRVANVDKYPKGMTIFTKIMIALIGLTVAIQMISRIFDSILSKLFVP